MLTKFGVAMLIFGVYGPQNMYINNRFRPAGRHNSRINVIFGTADGEGTEDHSIRWRCAVNKRPAGDALPSR